MAQLSMKMVEIKKQLDAKDKETTDFKTKIAELEKAVALAQS